MPARTRPLLALALAALTLAGCGGAAKTVREPGAAFTVTLDDYLIRPQRIRIAPGRLTVTVVNHGRLGHTFRIRAGVRNVLKITTIPPGKSTTRTFKLAKGTYTTYCALSNHEELGMYGTLVVR
jgi:plastocyanin